MQACFLKTNLFISFASKFFEKWFSITSILRPVCAIMQRNNLNKKKIFLFFENFRILIEKNCKLESICCPFVKTALSVSKGTVWEEYQVFKKNCLNQLSKIFCKLLRNVFNTVAKTALYKSGWISHCFQVSYECKRSAVENINTLGKFQLKKSRLCVRDISHKL